MYTKSLIQQQIECIQAKSKFGEDLKYLMEKYDINDAIFAIGEDGHMKELTIGYFAPIKEVSDVEECVREMEVSMGVRVKEGKITLGNVYFSLNECQEKDHVVNIEYLEDVY